VSSAYYIESLDLGTVREKFALVPTLGGRVGAVYCAQLDAPAFVHFGSGPAWPLEQGKTYPPCPPETDGIQISNPLGAGTLVLGISYDQGEIAPA
jgi:hypothetical protein